MSTLFNSTALFVDVDFYIFFFITRINSLTKGNIMINFGSYVDRHNNANNNHIV